MLKGKQKKTLLASLSIKGKIMTYKKKSYCFSWGNKKMRTFHGHITKTTAIKYGFDLIVLYVFDFSGKGRTSEKHIYSSNPIQLNQLRD